MKKSLTDRTLTSVNWNFLNTYTSAIVNIIIGVILSRLLQPKDFGLIGMVVIFTGLADLFATLGMGRSIIKKRDINENHIRTATTITMSSSILIFLIFYLFAPVISTQIYDQPKLIPILRVLATIFILKGINTVSYAQIVKSLDFKAIMLINISSTITYGGISAALALMGYGVWSLVFGKIISQVLSVILSTIKYPVLIRPSIKKTEFKELASFGATVSLSNILFYGSSNIDYFMIGKFINDYSLGLYTRAFNIVQQSMGTITSGIYTVLFPAFAAVQNEKEKLRKAYLRTVQTISYILFPLLTALYILSDYVVKGLYGLKWTGAIMSFKILTIAGFLRVSLQYSGAIAQATGRAYAEAFRQFVYFAVMGIFAYFLLPYGIEGVAFAVLIARVWMFVALSNLAIQIVESSWLEFIKTHIPAFGNSVIMIFINLFLIFILENYLHIRSNEVKLIILATVNVPVFLLALVFVPSSIKGDTFDWLLDKYKKYIPSFFLKFYFSYNAVK